MAGPRIPDPALLARLRASVDSIGWAASRVRPWQHQPIDDLWPAHQQIAHLLAVETENFQPRIRRILAEERPVLESWNGDAFNAAYSPQGDIQELAERFTAERAATVALLEQVSPSQWSRTGTWPDGTEIDLAWLAEKVLWHELDHLAQLLDLHGEFEPKQG